MNRTAKCLGFLVLIVVVLAGAYLVAGTTGLLLAGCVVSSATALALAAILYQPGFARPAFQQMHTQAKHAVEERGTAQAGAGAPGFQARQPAILEQTLRGLTHDSRDALQQGQACLELLALKTRDQPEVQELVTDVQKALDRLLHLYENARRHCSTNGSGQ